MRVHIAWPILLALIAAVLLCALLYNRSGIPDYGESEPLYPTVAKFGRTLADSKTEDLASTINNLLLEDRFSAIQPYGVVFSNDPDTLVTIRVNKTFSFDIALDGTPKWIKN